MKRCLYLLLCCGLYAQSYAIQAILSLNWANLPIPVYYDSISDNEVAHITQDTLCDIYYFTDIIGKSERRYYVQLEYDEDTNFCPNKEIVTDVKGWIDKKYICTYLLVDTYEPENGTNRMVGETFLYEIPCEDSKCIVLYDVLYMEALLIDYFITDKGEVWGKILVTIDGTTYVGWTQKMCNNISTSCN